MILENSDNKTLTLIRHAKSSWKFPDLDDFDRPLNKRGKQDAPHMAARLIQETESLDLILSSGAKRALDTALCMANAMSIPQKDVVINNDLYLPEPEDVQRVLDTVEDRHQHIALVLHNPCITELANHFQQKLEIFNIPTSGIISFSFEHRRWKELFGSIGTLNFFIYPKRERIYSRPLK